jgi:hypothetical protein
VKRDWTATGRTRKRETAVSVHSSSLIFICQYVSRKHYQICASYLQNSADWRILDTSVIRTRYSSHSAGGSR